MSRKNKKEVKHPGLRRFLISMLCILCAVVLVVSSYAAYVLIDYHRIEDNQQLEIKNTAENNPTARVGETYSAVTYNVGFGAYTPEYSFFMDGGKFSRAFSEDSVRQSIQNAAKAVKDTKADIILLQEVDLNSTRSYHVDQSAIFCEMFPDYCYNLAVNYDSPYLFYPLIQPHGKSLSALGTYSRLKMTSSVRRSLPVSDSLSRLLDLDRCYTVSRIPVENGSELIIYTVHMSAYGNSDKVREGQKQMLKEDMEAEVKKGNYVICGGDFNHNLLPDANETNAESWAYPYPRSYVPDGMVFCLDLLTREEIATFESTTRNDDAPYTPGVTQCFTVDGFMISENIEMVSYYTVDTQFGYSDHNPVQLKFKLK